jgi:hypothetical protein
VVAIVVAIVVALAVMLAANPFPVSNTYITIDINPSIEIETDSSDNIVNVRGLNPEAIVMLDHETEKLTGKNVFSGIVDILTLAADTMYLDPARTNNDIVISAVNDNQDHEDLVFEKLSEKANGFYQEKGLKGNITRVAVNAELREEARQLDMSAGKLAKIKEAMNAKPELTLEKAKEMPVRDLNNIIKNYSKATEDFQNAYDIQLGNLVTEKTQENENRLQEHIITVDRVFQGYSKVNVDREYHKLIYNGNAFKKEHCIDYGMNFTEELIRVYDADDSFIGIYQYDLFVCLCKGYCQIE